MASPRRFNLRLALLLAALLAVVRPAGAAIAFDASPSSCRTGAANSQACSFAAAKPTAGAVVGVWISYFRSGAAANEITTPTDNQTGNTYTLLKAICGNNAAANGCVALYYALNVNVSGTYTVTETPSSCASVCAISVGLMSFTGVATSSATDSAGASDFGLSTVRDGGLFTTTNAADVVVAAATDSAVETIVAGTGYTTPASFNFTDNVDQNLLGEYQIVAATNNYNPAWTGGGNLQWGGVDGAFKAAAAAAAPTRTLLGVGKARH